MSYYIVERRQYLGDAQTKCTRHRPWCGGDIDALGLGAAGSYATLGAKAATHHGRRIFLAYSVAELGLIPYVGCYVGTVWQRETKISRVTIGFKLVPSYSIIVLLYYLCIVLKVLFVYLLKTTSYLQPRITCLLLLRPTSTSFCLPT